MTTSRPSTSTCRPGSSPRSAACRRYRGRLRRDLRVRRPAATCPSASRVGEVNARHKRSTRQRAPPSRACALPLRTLVRTVRHRRSRRAHDRIRLPPRDGPSDLATLGVDAQPAAAIFATRPASRSGSRATARADSSPPRMPRVVTTRTFATSSASTSRPSASSSGALPPPTPSRFRGPASSTPAPFRRISGERHRLLNAGHDAHRRAHLRRTARHRSHHPCDSADPANYVPWKAARRGELPAHRMRPARVPSVVEVTTTERTPGTPTAPPSACASGSRRATPCAARSPRPLPSRSPLAWNSARRSVRGPTACSSVTPLRLPPTIPPRASQCPDATRAAIVHITTPLSTSRSRAAHGSGRRSEETHCRSSTSKPRWAARRPTRRHASSSSAACARPDDGTLTTTFTNAPQLRFSELELTFPAGDPRALRHPAAVRHDHRTVGAHSVVDERCDPVGRHADDRPRVPTVARRPSRSRRWYSQAGASAATRIDLARRRTPVVSDDQRAPALRSARDLNAAASAPRPPPAPARVPGGLSHRHRSRARRRGASAAPAPRRPAPGRTPAGRRRGRRHRHPRRRRRPGSRHRRRSLGASNSARRTRASTSAPTSRSDSRVSRSVCSVSPSTSTEPASGSIPALRPAPVLRRSDRRHGNDDHGRWRRDHTRLRAPAVPSAASSDTHRRERARRSPRHVRRTELHSWGLRDALRRRHSAAGRRRGPAERAKPLHAGRL